VSDQACRNRPAGHHHRPGPTPRPAGAYPNARARADRDPAGHGGRGKRTDPV